VAATVTCDLLFAPGTWTTSATATKVSAALVRRHVTYATAQRRGVGRRTRLRFHVRHRLRHGRYTLELKLGRGRHMRMLRTTVRL
jgi:hypothetical protein